MRFEEFAAAHGLLIKNVEFGRWVRVNTEDKPGRKNGAYRHMGDVAFVQNHGTMPEVACWFPDKDSDIKIDRAEIARIRANADRQIENNRKAAQRKSSEIVKLSRFEQHAYLDSHGFPDSIGLVYRPVENTNLLVIPMRVGFNQVGCQLIDKDGGKKFLFGQRCAGAEFVIDGHGVNIWVEGYATGLSVAAATKAINLRCCIHICFSAGNMESMAKSAGNGFVIADNDLSGTGERAAKATGLKYYLPEIVGEDFNDEWKREGTFRSSQRLRKAFS